MPTKAQLKVTVFGASGAVGRHFVRLALKRGYHLTVLVRNAEKYGNTEEKVSVVQGDSSNIDDVRGVVQGASVVVSCLGNVNKVTIMEKSHGNIIEVAGQQPEIPRCILISTIGCGGTSRILRHVLSWMGGGYALFDDYERADKLIREQNNVPCVIIRPYALTNKPGKRKYKTTKNLGGNTFAKPISREDVALAMVDALSNKDWDGRPGGFNSGTQVTGV